MMFRMQTIAALLIGVIIGAASGMNASADVAYVKATPSLNPVYLNGQKINLEAYNINGNNYVKLRDVGRSVNFNVSWDEKNKWVTIDSTSPYQEETNITSQTQTIHDTLSPTSSAPGDSTYMEDSKKAIINMTNSARNSRGLSTLKIDRNLMAAAQVRAEEMALTTTYSHTRPNGSAYYTVTDCRSLSENIHRISDATLAYYEKDLAVKAVEDWTESSGHFENMLGANHVSIGVGIAKGVNASGEDAYYCVQLFLYKGGSVNKVNGMAI